MTEHSLRLVFMGTPEFAVPTLRSLIERGHSVVGVCTQPDRRSGRGRSLSASPVKSFAVERGLPVFQPSSLRCESESPGRLADLEPDAIVVAAYGLFLPPEIMNLPRLGCLNVHPSLLPRHRGPSPVATAILNGDDVTGVTIILLDEGMDSGPILARRETPVGDTETASVLTERLFNLGASLLVETLDRWNSGLITPTPQNDQVATFTTRLRRENGLLNWGDDAVTLARQIRAYAPWPGTHTSWMGRVLKVRSANAVDARLDAPPGTVVMLDNSVVAIVAGEGALEVGSLQLEGRRAVTASEFVRGYPDFVASKLGD